MYQKTKVDVRDRVFKQSLRYNFFYIISVQRQTITMCEYHLVCVTVKCKVNWACHDGIWEE